MAPARFVQPSVRPLAGSPAHGGFSAGALSMLRAWISASFPRLCCAPASIRSRRASSPDPPLCRKTGSPCRASTERALHLVEHRRQLLLTEDTRRVIATETVKKAMLSAETREVVVHLRSKIGSAQAERLSRSGILTYFRRDIWSGRQDLNLRPPGPEPGALPG